MSEAIIFPGEVPSGALVSRASLESILCTEELSRRPYRAPDFEKENHAVFALLGVVAKSPAHVLQSLAEMILDITQSDSAGFSLLTRDGKTPDASGARFYWPAIAGVWSAHVGAGTHRNCGPCGDVLDQNRTLLFRHAERRYPYLLSVVPPAEECLLVPFYVHGKAVGTIWAITHSDRHKFDSEDSRFMNSLGNFASLAYQSIASIDSLKLQVAERERVEPELRMLTKSLERQVRARTVELERSKAYLAKAQALSHTGSFGWQIASGELYWSAETYRILGCESNVEPSLERVFERIHPEDRQFVRDMMEHAARDKKDFEFQHRLLMQNGSIKFVQVMGHPSGGEESLEFVGAITDITDRRLGEEAVAGISRKLIEAHEEERKWIARELHDDLSQRIALLTVYLDNLRHGLSASEVQSRHGVEAAMEQLSILGTEVHALSHRLHSSKLEILGLKAACEGFCKELSRRQNVKIDFHCEDVPNDISKETSLCLFRVLQEALQNAFKHSGVRRFEVSIKGSAAEIRLNVNDSGMGFDLDSALAGQGIGLTSMKERLKLVDGELSIESTPSRGTRVSARVPIAQMGRSFAGAT